MFKKSSLLGFALLAGILATGCAGPEKKLGRGISNMGEITRWGDARRSMEQSGIWHSPNGQAGGLVAGVAHSLTRIGLGVYEVVTFPIPSYDPVLTGIVPASPTYPDSFKPGLPDDPTYATDTNLGFSGGDIAPWFPGSRFSVFNTP